MQGDTVRSQHRAGAGVTASAPCRHGTGCGCPGDLSLGGSRCLLGTLPVSQSLESEGVRFPGALAAGVLNANWALYAN